MSLLILIMAGGLGKRMKSKLPKVLHKVMDIPMVVHVLRTAKKLNPIKIGIVVGQYKDIIKDTILQYEDLKLVEFIIQEIPKGTGHAIQCSVPFLERNDSSNVLILSGDNPLIHISTLENLLKYQNKCVLMTTIFDNPYVCGRIIKNNKKFIKIVEERDCDEKEKLIKLVNCGIYKFNNKYLCKNIILLNNNNSQKEYYLTDVIELIKNNEKTEIGLYELPNEEQYQLIGVNTKKQLEELNLFMKKKLNL